MGVDDPRSVSSKQLGLSPEVMASPLLDMVHQFATRVQLKSESHFVLRLRLWVAEGSAQRQYELITAANEIIAHARNARIV